MVRKPQKTQKPQKTAVRKRSDEKERAAIDFEALAHFRYRLRLFVTFTDENAKNAGLTSQQYQALLAIRASPGGNPCLSVNLPNFCSSSITPRLNS